MRSLLVLCRATVLLLALPVAAGSWPEKVVRLVVPYPPGGNVDLASRIVGNKLQEILGQPFVTENKAGAGGLIAGEYVAKSPPDGYTIFVTANGPLLFSPLIFQRPVYQWDRDFVPIGSVSFTPMVLQVHPAVPAKTIAEFLDLAGRRELFMASPGAGTTNHLASELLQRVTGAHWTTVHYKGNAPATTDLLAGQVDFNFDQLSVSLPYLKEGRLLPLAVTATHRLAALPEVPTFIEAGFKDFTVVTFTGLFAPAQTPAPIVARLSQALAKLLADPEVIDRFQALGAEARAMRPDAFFDYIRKEDETWSPIIKAANIKAD